MKQNGVNEAGATNPTSSSSSSSDQTGSSSGSSLTPSSGTSATGESYHSSGVTSSSSGSGSSSYTEASSTVSTLPPVTEDEDGDEPDGPPRSKNWGLLLSANERLFDNFGLQQDQYLFGRARTSDYVFELLRFPGQGYFKSLSNNHFKIFRELHSAGDKNDYTVFLEDLSANGTAINGTIVGQKKTRILNSGDEISLVYKKAFIFHDIGETEAQQDKYPKELTEKYTIAKILGQGACGEVRLAYQQISRKQYAVKIIQKKRFSVGVTMSKSMMDEVNILRTLDHPGVIKIEDFFDAEDTLFIVLELVRGGELFDRVVKMGKFTETISKLLFYQMLCAVDYLHSNKITHRDLKPENVLLQTDDKETAVKITDFGLSRIVGENSLMRTLCGTPNYLAPEVIKTGGTGGYSKAVDCWSLGCILFICLGGYPPFSSEHPTMSLYEQILQGFYSFPDEHWRSISQEAKDLIKKLLTVDEKERISVSDALRHPWLEDEGMRSKARSLMYPEGEPMPPPAVVPAVRKSSSSDEGQPEAKRPRISSEKAEE
ncbi:serine/threonine-protein kinase Chk2-like isoform X2 [Rhopilema esculentum]|uniref:serine/threonine-protein kinase Chk2-like isoform X2 n=1 Tax=Rhopilema esculentum TaxID=499914 RepID=UPI0031D14448